MDGTERKTPNPWRIAVAVLAVAVLAASTWAWLDARSRIGATQDELARRLRDIETDAREARALARQAQESMREVQGKLGALEGKLADAQSQQVALEALYQDLSRNRDEWQLAEIEQVLAIAAQQLQLSGNVRAALLALHSRNQGTYQEDLRAAQQWLQKYFDQRARATQQAQAHLRQLQAATLSFEPPPSISDSLEAVRGFKSRRERSSG